MPDPVICYGARRIETSAGVEPKQILHRNDHQPGNRPKRRLNNLLRDLVSGKAKVPVYMVSGALIQRPVPAKGGVVIVRTGVHQVMFFMIVKQMGITGAAIKTE